LLLAASGFRYDGGRQALDFAPILTPERFKSFFTAPEGWGSLEQSRDAAGQRNAIRVVEGHLPLAFLRLSVPAGMHNAALTLAGARLPAHLKTVEGGAVVTPAAAIDVQAGQVLVIAFS